jgi:hypothetical protein
MLKEEDGLVWTEVNRLWMGPMAGPSGQGNKISIPQKDGVFLRQLIA